MRRTNNDMFRQLEEQGLAEHIILSDVSDDEDYVSDWTVDLKNITVYTEFRRSPGKPPIIQYGSNLKAHAVYLSTIGLIAYKRLSQFFSEISHNLLNVSKATLADFNHSAANAVFLSDYISDLLNGTVLHVDELYSSKNLSSSILLFTSVFESLLT